MRTLSNTSSAVSEDSQPVFFRARPTLKPGVPFSTMKPVNLSPSTLANTTNTSAKAALVM